MHFLAQNKGVKWNLKEYNLVRFILHGFLVHNVNGIVPTPKSTKMYNLGSFRYIEILIPFRCYSAVY